MFLIETWKSAVAVIPSAGTRRADIVDRPLCSVMPLSDEVDAWSVTLVVGGSFAHANCSWLVPLALASASRLVFTGCSFRSEKNIIIGSKVVVRSFILRFCPPWT